MITFKEFISEAIVKKWRADTIEVEKAIALLNAHCKEGIKALTNGGTLYRGFTDAQSHAFRIMDPTKGERTSRDTDNMYQLMMDSSLALKSFPKRSKSLICTTSIRDANQYGHGSCCVVIPFDGTRLAVSSTADFLYSEVAGEIARGEIDQVGKTLSDLFNFISGKKTRSFSNAEELNSVLAQFTPDELLILWSMENKTEYGAFTRAISFTCPSTDVQYLLSGKASDKTFNTLRQKIKDASLEVRNYLTPAGKKLKELLSSESNRFTSLASNIMSPTSISVSSVTYGGPLPKNSEVWFANKAIVIDRTMFARILHVLINEHNLKPSKQIEQDFWRDLESIAMQEKNKK